MIDRMIGQEVAYLGCNPYDNSSSWASAAASVYWLSDEGWFDDGTSIMEWRLALSK